MVLLGTKLVMSGIRRRRSVDVNVGGFLMLCSVVVLCCVVFCCEFLVVVR